jgi:ribosomal protein S18 acetylase RimI-like enzyme
MEGVAIRPARPEDLPTVLTLWSDADAEPTHTDDLDSLTALLAHDPDALILAVRDDRIVGSVIAGWDGWRGSIYRLVVAPAERRRGLGRLLLRAAQDRLDARGAIRSQAIVVESDDQALGFWQASGWSQQEDRVRFVKG